MEVASMLNLLMHGNQLKRTPRSGWLRRGVARPESVAAHSYGVIIATMLLADEITETVDLGKALAMAALHDLPEGLTTDIPSPAWKLFPAGAKEDAERRAMEIIFEQSGTNVPLVGLWKEYNARVSAEARLVHDADKLDMYLQVSVYESQTGNRQLAEFWEKPHAFYFPEAQMIYDALRAERDS